MKKFLLLLLFSGIAINAEAQDCTPQATIDENFETFTSQALPQGCWSSNRPYPYAYLDGTDNRYIQTYSLYAASTPTYIFTPELEAINADLTLSFDAFVKSGGAAGGTLQVGTISDLNNVETFTPIGDAYTLEELTGQYQYSLPLVDTSDKYVAFKFSYDGNHAPLALDNVKIESALGIGHTNQSVKLDVYPNPVVNEVNVSTNDRIINVELYDLSGKKLLQTNTSKINLSTYKSGVYVLKIKTDKGEVVKKIIKK